MTRRCEVARTFPERVRGLLFRRRPEDGADDCRELVLTPCRDVHTFGMRERIDVAFVDHRGVVVAVHRGLPARRRVRDRRAHAVIERFAEPDAWLHPGDRVRVRAEFAPAFFGAARFAG